MSNPTHYNRWRRWGDKGIFAPNDGGAIRGGGSQDGDDHATYLKAHRTATSLRSKKGGSDDQRGRLIGWTKGGMNTKLPAVADADGRPIRFFMTAGQSQRLHRCGSPAWQLFLTLTTIREQLSFRTGVVSTTSKEPAHHRSLQQKHPRVTSGRKQSRFLTRTVYNSAASRAFAS